MCIRDSRSHVVKTRMTEEEYADFTGRLEHYDISQAEFIRQAITPVSYTHLDVYKRQALDSALFRGGFRCFSLL